MSNQAHRGAAIAVALMISACGPSENDARQHLEQEGFTVTSLKKNESSFEFTGTKGENICTGTVTIQKGFGSTNHSLFSTCQRDTSACKPGAAAACVKLADEMYSREANVFPTPAAGLYRTACEDADGHACARVAEFEAIDKTWDKVRSYAQKGCDLGNADACTRLGFTELKGHGTEKNEAKAIELTKKACEKGAMDGCRAAAGILLDKEPADPTAALPLAEKLCSAKFEDGCFVLGMALFAAKKDYALALTHLEASCNDATFKNRGLACNIAGAITFDGLGMKKDPARGIALLEKSCEYGHAEGCSNAGNMYQKGIGVPRSKEKADALFASACKLGKQEHCSAK